MEDIPYTFGLYVAESIFITPFPLAIHQKCLETSYHPEAVGVGAHGMGSETWQHHFLTVRLWASDSSSVKWE